MFHGCWRHCKVWQNDNFKYSSELYVFVHRAHVLKGHTQIGEQKEISEQKMKTEEEKPVERWLTSCSLPFIARAHKINTFTDCCKSILSLSHWNSPLYWTTNIVFLYRLISFLPLLFFTTCGENRVGKCFNNKWFVPFVKRFFFFFH